MEEENEKENEKEFIQFSYTVDLGNYIEGLIYKRETELAVMFGREKDDKICWIPKSAIKGRFKKNYYDKQNIRINFSIKTEWQESYRFSYKD